MGRPAAVLLLLTALAVGGCRGIGPAARSQPTPSATPVGAHIGVVDVETVARAHPRWPELDALTKKLADVAAQLATPPQLSPVVRARIDARLRAQAKKLEAEFQAEVAALRARQAAKLARYVAQLRAEQAAKLNQLRAQIDGELKKGIDARATTLRADLRQYEAQVLEEYRFPIANLRLKTDVVGVATEDELRRITGELDRLLTERDGRVRARAEVLDVVLRDFERARIAEANARLDKAQKAAEVEINRLVVVKKKELDAEARRLTRAKQRAFEGRMNAFRRQLLSVGEGQLASAQGQYVEGLRQREQQLLAERQALQEQRARLEDSILADVKIEVAAIAAARGFDVVLTRYLTNLTGEDMTTDVLARLKR
ncbi:MAG: outer membrane chaperone Skp [Armatimonadetes bacterium CSP1-3]|nr:MAG: outer membrane chaperone Skp [Armatimonadetes bacterium CSP1-3]